MKSPYVYFGGKAKVADEVWSRFGTVDTYVEPFYGSGAVHLANPDWQDTTETINDLDHYVANFWRAVKHAPDEVAFHADYPISEVDLHARHIWLVNEGRERIARCEIDTDHYDAQVAGWWVWGMAIWIGHGFCSGKGPWTLDTLKAAREAGHYDARRIEKADGEQGVARQLPHLRDGGQGIMRTTSNVYDMIAELSARFARVRVCCGSWDRIMGPSVTWAGEIGAKQSICGVFLDPPYSAEAGRSEVYTREDFSIAHDVREWCKANGDNTLMRIALCGYDGEGHEELIDAGWSVHTWSARGGYGVSQNRTRALTGKGESRGAENKHRECIWFSPHCLTGQAEAQGSLFEVQS